MMKKEEVNWRNPYAKKGKLWIKGNLHTHTNKSGCGVIPPDDVVRIYEKMGYVFLAITDHNLISNPRDYHSRLILLPGIEVDFQGGNHTCIINADRHAIDYHPNYPHQQLIDRNVQRGGMVVLNHPDWLLKEHYPLDELFRLNHYTGLEIYNSVIERLMGASLSTAKWDRLLCAGKRVLGFANQDSHIPADYSDCCNVARVSAISRKNILKALLTGNFYCYHGVTIQEVGRRGSDVYIQTANARLIRFIGNGGKVLKKVKRKSAEIKFAREPADQYIRIECLGMGEQISWTQPFFKE